MDLIKAKIIFCIVFIFCAFSFTAKAQESLWKTVNPHQIQDVPSYSGGLSPFPQKQKQVEELAFEQVVGTSELEVIEESSQLTEAERNTALATSILAELKDFLDNEEVYIPNFTDVVIEAIAKSDGNYITLIDGDWLKISDSIYVPVDEAADALGLLERLRDVDQELATTVEEAVLERTEDNMQEEAKIVGIEDDKVIFEDNYGEMHVINFVKAPF